MNTPDLIRRSPTARAVAFLQQLRDEGLMETNWFAVVEIADGKLVVCTQNIDVATEALVANRCVGIGDSFKAARATARKEVARIRAKL
jgi:hypothetical protein